MRRLIAIALALLTAGLLIALPAAGDDDGPYKVRGIFDNGAFIVEGEEVRVAGATIGVVESVDVTGEDEIASLEDGGIPVPGKAVVVMKIEDDAFKDFREDASCIIRPQSLIGEKLVDCRQTQPRAPGQEAPPELSVIEDGEPGAGQHLLPLENNGKAVDLDLINNINRMPYRDRFRLIINDLGAGLAARGDDLGEVIDRANPALRQTNRVLKILADHNRQLASLASDGDTVLEPLARNRTSVTGFLRNASIAGQATAERSVDLEAGLQKFPETLRQVRATMKDLKEFADQGTPLMDDLGAAAPDFSRATQKLAPFARAGIPALITLGNAGEAAGPKLVASDPVIVDLRDLGANTKRPAKNLADFLRTFNETNGFQYLMDFIYYSSSSINGFDDFGHFLRANLQITNCLDWSNAVFTGCEANFLQTGPAPTAAPKKKKKKKKKKSASARIAPAQPPDPPILPPLEEILPELQPEDPGEAEPTEPDQGEAGSGTPESQAEARAGGRKQFAQAPGDPQMRDASVFLQYLLGSGA